MTTSKLDPYSQMVFEEMVIAAKERQRQILSSGVSVLARQQASSHLGMTRTTSNLAYRQQQQQQTNNAAAILAEHADFITSLLVSDRLEKFRREQVAHLNIPRNLHEQPMFLRQQSSTVSAT